MRSKRPAQVASVLAALAAVVALAIVVWPRSEPTPKFCAGVGLVDSPVRPTPRGALAAQLDVLAGAGTDANPSHWEETDRTPSDVTYAVEEGERPSKPPSVTEHRLGSITVSRVPRGWAASGGCVG